ncbi:LuxR C-terminal-related transcriptional regulator [Streptomyces sp. NPDC057445]|uniref:LuxR C-terminal-related transcriptional regulator n=1 Tax=Streptomyces sp. NPDC057445 TaxID=3346136 RepID=UPI0036840D39
MPISPQPVLGEHELALYGWVLEHRSTDADRASVDLALPPETVTRALGHLVQLRLIRVDSEDPVRARAVDPDAVATRLTTPLKESIRSHQNALERIQNDIEQLRERFLRRTAPEPARSALEVIPSVDEVRAALNRESAECREEMLTSQPGGNRVPAVLEEALARDHALLSRGVRMRTLYHHTARFNGPSQAYVAAATALGAEYRTAHELFGRLILFDRKVAFIPEREDTWGAVVIREPSVVAYLHEVFEQAWNRATPFSDAGHDGLERVAKEIDRTIVRLLAQGLKDETIGRRLGMSLRTTRRHVADIMEALGAESRFQAGILLARAEWLHDDEQERR